MRANGTASTLEFHAIGGAALFLRLPLPSVVWWHAGEGAMAESSLKQRLAAILAADAAGYSRLMASDERGTVIALDHARAVFRKHIESNQGRVVDMAGDSVLAIFELATGALSSALAIQRDFDSTASDVPRERRLLFRIGVHVGEIIEKPDGTIYGDGVNTAARLQTLAESGGVSVSQALKEQIPESFNVSYAEVSGLAVKNMPRPIRMYRVVTSSLGSRSIVRTRVGHLLRRGWRWAALATFVVAGAAVGLTLSSQRREESIQPELLSVTVLQFRSETTEANTVSFAAKLGHQVFSAISPERSGIRVKGLGVETGDLRRIRNELKARYALAGVVSARSELLKVEARLVDTTNEEVVWADSFEIPEVFGETALEKTTKRLASQVLAEVPRLERIRVTKQGIAHPSSMELVLLGYDVLGANPESASEADKFFQRALQLEKGNVPAMLGRAVVLEKRYRVERNDDMAASLVDELDNFAREAVTTDPLCANSWTMRADVLAMQGKKQEASMAMERALSINPSNLGSMLFQRRMLVWWGRADQALLPLEDATFYWGKNTTGLASEMAWQCTARVYLLRLDDAQSFCERWYTITPNENAVRTRLALHALRGDAADVARLKSELGQFSDSKSIGAIKQSRRRMWDGYTPEANAQAEASLYRGLRLAGLPES